MKTKLISYKDQTLGYGFGGDCALELASLDANPDLSLKGAIAVYGHFEARPLKKVKLLILHGFDDVVAPKEEALAFGEQMSKDGADFQLHLFSQTGHSFMNPSSANFHLQSSKRVETLISTFLTQTFQ